MLNERDRHTLHGLYALTPCTYYVLALREGPQRPHLEIRRGSATQHVSLPALRRLDLDLVSGSHLVTPHRITPLRDYVLHASVREALTADVFASAARHPGLTLTLRRLCQQLSQQPGQRITLLSPDPLSPDSSEVLRRHHALASGPYTLHLQRSSRQTLDTTYSVTDRNGKVMPMTEQALAQLLIIPPGEDVMLLRRPDGRFDAVPSRQYRLNPVAHQPAVSSWALNHPAYGPVRTDLLSRGLLDRTYPSGPYDLSFPLLIP